MKLKVRNAAAWLVFLAAAYVFSLLFYSFVMLPQIYRRISLPGYDTAALALIQWRDVPYYLAMTTATILLVFACRFVVERIRRGGGTRLAQGEPLVLKGFGIRLEISFRAARNALVILLGLQFLYCLLPYDLLAYAISQIIPTHYLFDPVMARENGWKRLIACTASKEVIHQSLVYVTAYLYTCLAVADRPRRITI